MPIPHLNKTLTALAGEFLVAGQLCLRGYVASLTLKNYPDVDIFALNPITKKYVEIQVKTARAKMSQHKGVGFWPPGVYFVPEKVPDIPFIFVAIDPSAPNGSAESVSYFVVPGPAVAHLRDKERQAYFEWAQSKGRVVKPAQPSMVSLQALEPYRDRWDKLELDASS